MNKYKFNLFKFVNLNSKSLFWCILLLHFDSVSHDLKRNKNISQKSSIYSSFELDSLNKIIAYLSPLYEFSSLLNVNCRSKTNR